MLQPEENQHPRLGDQPDAPTMVDSISALVRSSIIYMERVMPRFLQDLETLCLIESPSDYKPGLDAMADQLAELLQRAGMQTTIIEHSRGNAVIGTLVGDNPTAPDRLLIGHHDT